jgi:hypothetical protein
MGRSPLRARGSLGVRLLCRFRSHICRGTHRVLAGGTGYSLTGYSDGTHTPGSSHRRLRCAARVQRQEGYSRRTPRVLIGCSRVLTGYSEGADRVLKGTHAALLLLLFAVSVGRGGKCTVVCRRRVRAGCKGIRTSGCGRAPRRRAEHCTTEVHRCARLG